MDSIPGCNLFRVLRLHSTARGDAHSQGFRTTPIARGIVLPTRLPERAFPGYAPNLPARLRNVHAETLVNPPSITGLLSEDPSEHWRATEVP